MSFYLSSLPDIYLLFQYIHVYSTFSYDLLPHAFEFQPNAPRPFTPLICLVKSSKICSYMVPTYSHHLHDYIDLVLQLFCEFSFFRTLFYTLFLLPSKPYPQNCGNERRLSLWSSLNRSYLFRTPSCKHISPVSSICSILKQFFKLPSVTVFGANEIGRQSPYTPIFIRSKLSPFSPDVS